MIVANLATYPPRAGSLRKVVARILPQVDRLNIVFNQYDNVPQDYVGVPKIMAILPYEDTKDAGKFYPQVAAEDIILYIDDDVDYPADFVARTMQNFDRLPTPRALAGYHSSLYFKPAFSFSRRALRAFVVFHLHSHKIARYRKVYGFLHDVMQPIIVDQVATNAAVIHGADAPSYDYMRGSQKFVDVRLARWCFETGVTCVALPRAKGWLSTPPDETSIFSTFTTSHPRHVAEEIWAYAFKGRNRGVKIPLGP